MFNEPKFNLENSQTLFRFKTVRAPQKIDDAKIKDFFIEHPNIGESGLLAGSNEEFQLKINQFNPSPADMFKDRYTDMYKLSESILQARSFVPQGELIEKIKSSQTLSQEDLMQIWENFSYQVFSQQSHEDREILGTLIYGNFVIDKIKQFAENNPPLNKLESIWYEEDEFRRLLQARIVIPIEFISPSTQNEEAAIEDTSKTSYFSPQKASQLMNATKILNADNKIAITKQLMSDIALAEKMYQKIEAKNMSEHQATVDAETKAAFEAYKAQYPELFLSQKEQEARGIDVNSFPAFEAPKNEYTPLAELDKEFLDKKLSAKSKTAIELFLDPSVESFEALKSKIFEAKSSAYQEKMEAIPAHSQEIYIDGFPISEPQLPSGAGFDTNFGTFSACTMSVGLVGGGYRTTFDCTCNFTNTSEVATSIKYKFDENEDWKSKNVTGSSFSVDKNFNEWFANAFGSSSSTIIVEITSNLGIVYAATLNILETTCNITDLALISGSSSSGNTTKAPTYGVTRVGIMDYRKVEQYICCYVPGEVSHIENVMAREYKSRTTRRLRRSENTTTTSTESEREKLTDTASTEKNEMQEEISKLMQESNDFNVNAGINWTGFVNGHVDSSFAYHNSKEESNKLAKSVAKELTMKATERLLDKTREERIQKIIEEYSDENQHGVDNRQGDKHISGVYRWVDKIYKNQVHNYGKRMLYEFMIPEPASFHLSALTTKQSAIQTALMPSTLENFGIYSADNINDSNYLSLASAFQIEVEAPPAYKILSGRSYAGDGINGGAKSSFNDLKIPEGYILNKFSYDFDSRSNTNTNTYANFIIGNKKYIILKNIFVKSGVEYSMPTLTDGTIPVSVTSWDISVFVLDISCEFIRTNEHYNEWKNKVFLALKKSYDERYAAYLEQVKEIESQKDQVRETNPLFYREIEQSVLKKNCISFILDSARMGIGFVTTGNTLAEHSVRQDTELEDYAATVKFIEQAFEWEIMSYQFYPYYWADKSKWNELYTKETSDKLFTKFLQSGMARTMVTVRPGFEEAVQWFMNTGQVWMGSQPPVIGDKLFLSLIDELKQPESVIEEEWESRVPSTLTVIQADSIALDTTGLPCMDTCKEHKAWGFKEDHETLKNLTVKVD